MSRTLLRIQWRKCVQSMAYRLEFSKSFDKQFSKLDKSTQRYIFNWLIKHLDNVENPRYSGKSLTGNKQGLWRYRIGNYRVIADIHDDTCIILAVEVGHRRLIYL